jgi:serine/threonine protein phosphatase PrpC
VQVKTAGISEIGLKREGNEDAFSVTDSLGLYVVADGMGGHLAGEVASKIAVEMINKSFRHWETNKTLENELFGGLDNTLSLSGNYILSSIKLANRVINELAKENEEYHGMGTTVGAILVRPKLVIAANVGDSRIYMVRNNTIERLSNDHTMVAEQVEMGLMSEEEAMNSPLKHVLTRNLGSSEDVEPDIFEIEPLNNDRFILCTDGLTDLVSEQEILNLTMDEDNPGILNRRLVGRALDRGAHDNTTVISVFISGIEKPGDGKIKKIGLSLADVLINMQKVMKKIKP